MNTCLECGDGSRSEVFTCDDGNTDNGDGCSSTCTVETGWECSVATGSEVCTCAVNYFSVSGSCVSSCDSGFWGNTVTRTCDSCHAACASCTGALSTQC